MKLPIWCKYAVGIALLLSCNTASQGKQRLIVIVQEGLGHEMIEAARLYSDEPSIWDWRLDHEWNYASLSTLPLTTETYPNGSDPEIVPKYDKINAWNGSLLQTPQSTAGSFSISGYKWLIENASDPLQAATALGSGTPSFNTTINWLPYPSKNGSPLPSDQQLVEWSHYHGLQTGIVSDMPFSHAFNTILAGARTYEEDAAISRFHHVVEASKLNLFVATGHPKYNELGQALSKPDYVFSSQSDWQDLRSKARSHGWKVIYGDENLMGISNQSQAKNEKRLVILQFGNTTSTKAISRDSSGLSENLPTSLRFQVKMALDQLNTNNPKGFTLVIHMGRLPYLLKSDLQKESIEEVVHAFSVLNLCDQWVENNGGWNQTSLLLVSPYEYGLIWGSDSSTFPYSQIKARGKNRIPGFRLNHNGPTATLSPLLYRGAITPMIQHNFSGEDPIYGDYLSSSRLGQLLKNRVAQTQEPEQ